MCPEDVFHGEVTRNDVYRARLRPHSLRSLCQHVLKQDTSLLNAIKDTDAQAWLERVLYEQREE